VGSLKNVEKFDLAGRSGSEISPRLSKLGLKKWDFGLRSSPNSNSIALDSENEDHRGMLADPRILLITLNTQ
jgi:hypothetical protein